jgi:hypothetical protein
LIENLAMMSLISLQIYTVVRVQGKNGTQRGQKEGARLKSDEYRTPWVIILEKPRFVLMPPCCPVDTI